MHPLGKSPVISDGELTIAESGAIIEYLVERYGNGRLVPAMARKWKQINKFVEAGIPGFTQNTDVPSSKRFAFFALIGAILAAAAEVVNKALSKNPAGTTTRGPNLASNRA